MKQSVEQLVSLPKWDSNPHSNLCALFAHCELHGFLIKLLRMRIYLIATVQIPECTCNLISGSTVAANVFVFLLLLGLSPGREIF